MDDDLYEINDLIGFLDIDEDSDEIVLRDYRPMPELRVRSAIPTRHQAPIKTQHSIEDKLAMMRVTVENQTTIQERINEITTDLKRDQQNVVHYVLPTELMLSNL